MIKHTIANGVTLRLIKVEVISHVSLWDDEV